MSDELGITGIGGYNPYMNGLGTYGLGIGSSYGNYGDPTMMGMMGYNGIGMTGMTGMAGMGYGGMGMMGMYNPTFMRQMTDAYHEIEKANLEHASAMHKILQQNKVDDYKADDGALSQISMEDKGLESEITALARLIRDGDTDGACEQYDKLKLALYRKYNNYFRENRDRLDPEETVRGMIEQRYAAIMSAKDGKQASLLNDLKVYGETAFMHGFNKAFCGKKDYHDKYTEETLNYIYGTRIDNKRGKDRMEGIGGGFGRVAEGATAATAGATAGLGIAGILKVVNPSWLQVAKTEFKTDAAGNILKDSSGKAIMQVVKDDAGNVVKKCGVKFGKTAKWLGLAALAADLAWQWSRD